MTTPEPVPPSQKPASSAPAKDDPKRQKPRFVCDRCGHKMVEHRCKITCPNCGARMDCSDLNLYFD